jgi:hypothetical protein
MSPILHLDTDEADRASKAMRSDFNTMYETMSNLLQDTDGFLNQGGWIGPARDEFVELWKEWIKNIGDSTGELGSLTSILEGAVPIWIKASGKFGPS